MGDRNTTLATYLGDVHALEEHMLQPFERQLDLTKDTPEAHQAVQELVNSTRQRIQALERHMQNVSSEAPSKGMSDTFKTAVSGLMGMGAAAIDSMRPQSASKALRDSYTAMNLTIIAYVMLQTTSMALNDSATTQLAEQHLSSAVRNAQAIARAIPELVVKDVQDDVGNVDASAASRIVGNAQFNAIFGGGQTRTV